MKPDVFISYAHEDREAVAEPLALALRARRYQVWYDRFAIRPGNSVRERIEEGLATCRYGAFIISRAFFESRWTGEELNGLNTREISERTTLVIPVLHEITHDELAARAPMLAARSALSTGDGLPSLIEEIVRSLGPPAVSEAEEREPPPEEGRTRVEAILRRGFPGLYTLHEAFHAIPEPPNQVFAIELLARDLRLERLRNDRIRLTIDRGGATHTVVTTQGKNELCNRFLTREMLVDAQEMDCRVDRFLRRQGDEAVLPIPLDRWPLRWASGGVLSVVRWRGRTWTPFFFRDIAPFGWNLSLGSSERGDDLSNPWTFQIREFLEEMIVLDREPRMDGEAEFKRFYFDRGDLESQVRRAEEFAAEHIDRRKVRDRLEIRRSKLPAANHRLLVQASMESTRMEIEIHPGANRPPYRDVLLCINLLELGIEVVKVATWEMEDGDYLLDGEAYESDGEKELVRMPMALISHGYLRRAFGRDAAPPQYAARVQPSYDGPAFRPGEIHLFAFDAARRRAIALGETPGTRWEKERYEGWLKAYGKHFFDRRGGVAAAHAKPEFTPAAAKIMTYYFADRDQQKR
ncbi:MAG: toll/interleukin-1 receptor domain-containing protein [Longimicrobiaceae bacterium]